MRRVIVRGSWFMLLAMGCGMMPRYENIHKNVGRIVTSDLARTPVWEFCHVSDEQDECDEEGLRPRTDITKLTQMERGMFIVRAEFVSAEGHRYEGYVYSGSQKDNSLGWLQPVILVNDMQIPFWYGGVRPTEKEIKGAYEALGKAGYDLFPIAFRSPIAEVEGTITGFCYLEGKRVVEMK